MYPVILQARYNFFPDPDPAPILLTIAVLAGLAVLLIVTGYLSSRRETDRKKVNRFSLRIKGRSFGLTGPQVKFLEQTLGAYHITTPEIIFDNLPLFDSMLRRVMKGIENDSIPDQEKERRKELLFQIRRQIDKVADDRFPASSSRRLRMNQEVRIIARDQESFLTVVCRNHKDFLEAEIRQTGNVSGTTLQKGMVVKAFFTQDGKDQYSFSTRVLDFTTDGPPILILQHSDKLVHEQKRRYRRRPITKLAYFHPIYIIETGIGKKKTRQAMMDAKRRYMGTFIDISVGGCALKTSTPLTQGQLLKIDFNPTRDRQVSVLGKVRHVRKSQTRGAVMHIMFTKISRMNMNLIQEYVYGFSTD